MLNKKILMALAIAGFAQGTMIGEENPVKTMNIKDAEGNTIEIKEDGTKLIKRTDGTSIEIKPDGEKIIRKADGTIIDVKPNQ